MKKTIIKIYCSIAASLAMTGCGSSFLDTPMYDAVDLEGGLKDPATVSYALNGAYAYLLDYRSAGNYSSIFGDYASDIVYNDFSMGTHFDDIYLYSYTDTEGSFSSVWSYDYKVIDLAARVIEACENLKSDATELEFEEYQMYEAEARCLRAYASLMLVNIFGHQVMVNGQSYANEPGIVVVDNPIPAYQTVSRNTVGETYEQIINDLTTAIRLFQTAGSQNNLYYFSQKSAYGLLARANLYLENWSEAADAATKALNLSGITKLTYDAQEYKALYNGGKSNNESMFCLAISTTDNNGSNSAGQFFTGYGYSLSPYLMSLYAPTDCRLSIFGFANNESWWGNKNAFNGGKFGYFSGTNPNYATNYLVNAPEMFLIQAESYARQNMLSQAQNALLTVAMRNNAIKDTSDLPQTVNGVIEFLYEERARELFQEGLRLWDLRRWNINANLSAYDAPNIKYDYNNQHVGDLVFPIPSNEVNAGFGVTQNPTWNSSMPR